MRFGCGTPKRESASRSSLVTNIVRCDVNTGTPMRANRGDRVLRPRRVASAVHGQVGAAVPAVGFRIIRSNVIYNFALFDLHLYSGDAMVTPRVAASSASCRLTKAAVHSTRALAIPRAQRLPPRRRMPMHSPVAAAHPRSASSQRSATRASTSRVAPTALWLGSQARGAKRKCHPRIASEEFTPRTRANASGYA